MTDTYLKNPKKKKKAKTQVRYEGDDDIGSAFMT